MMASSHFGSWGFALEIAVLLIVLFLFLSMRSMTDWRRQLREKPGEALARLRDAFVLWLAEGFGVGRIPWAPGTFGSLVGLIWFAVLVSMGDVRYFAAGTVIGVACSVAICGAAERITGKKDPGSVVFDEIVAVPICFLPWLWKVTPQFEAMPAPEFFFGSRTWYWSLLLLALFRIFDIWKPWPIRPSQNLPGGWGVTIDDVLAAIAVAGLSFFIVVKS